MKRVFSSIVLAGLLASCSGGGGGGGAPPPAGNSPPAFTSAATVNAAENSAGTIYQATATDPDGNPLTFGLAGGPDACTPGDPGGPIPPPDPVTPQAAIARLRAGEVAFS